MLTKQKSIISKQQLLQLLACSICRYHTMLLTLSILSLMPIPKISKDFSIKAAPLSKIIILGLRNGSVLVHCAAGISRSATLVIAYLMKTRKIGFKQAIAFVRMSRNVRPNLGFQRQLKQYEKELVQGPQSRITLKKTITEKMAEQRRTSYNRSSHLGRMGNDFLKFQPRTAEQAGRRKNDNLKRIPFPHSQSRPRDRKNFKVRPLGKEAFFVVGLAHGGKQQGIQESIGYSQQIKPPIIQNHHKNAINNGWLKFQIKKHY